MFNNRPYQMIRRISQIHLAIGSIRIAPVAYPLIGSFEFDQRSDLLKTVYPVHEAEFDLQIAQGIVFYNDQMIGLS